MKFSSLREFTASVKTVHGTQAVTVRADSAEAATKKLLSFSYVEVLWIL